MRVLVAGASGVIGRQLVPMLAAAGHDVVGIARSAHTGDGAEIMAVDALDRDALARVVDAVAPDAIVNMLTAIPAQIDPKRLTRDFAMTNRLRTEGTRNLLDAAERSGVRRVVAQGLAYAYDPHSAGLADEDTPLWLDPPKPFAPVLAALKELERATLEAQGTVLRFGHLYGPSTSYAADGSFVRQVLDRQVPLVGGGTATFSFTHTHDAAAAVLAALESGHPGVFNIVDDHPAPMSEWLPFLATEIGAPPPRRAPAFLARMAVGSWGVAFMTQLRGASNARASRILGWQPRYPSWRTGFAAELSSKPTTRRSA
jgi:nucleoside-diphosphate-sugar epimerase